MKINMPVTQHEVELAENCLIVSKTDLKGQITYINRDFMEVSGFSEDELIGRSHNIVRHPDMPVEAFEDFWGALKENRPWVGLVKNRCKNGDFYWVEAHAAPIVQDGKTVGYMSVRRKAQRDRIQAAEAAYALFREGKAGGLRIRDGRVVQSGLFGPLRNVVAGLKVRSALVLSMAVLTVIVVAQGVIGVTKLADANQDGEMLVERRLKPSLDVMKIEAALAEARAQTLLGLLHAPDAAVSKMHEHPLSIHLDAMDKAQAEAERMRQGYAEYAKAAPEDQQARFKKLSDAQEAFIAQGLKPAREALAAGRYEDASRIVLNEVQPRYKTTMENGAAVLEDLAARVDEQRKHQASTMSETITLTVIGVVIAILFAAGLAWWLVRRVVGPLRSALDVFQQIAQGNFHSAIETGRRDELGQVLDGLESMQVRLGYDVAEAKIVSDGMAQIKVGLDTVETNVRIADNQGRVIYANPALLKTIRGIEDRIREHSPTFSADTFVGSSIGLLYPDSEAALMRLAALTQTTRTQMVIGGRTFDVTTSPIFSASGERLGSVGEWRDRTEELAAEREVQAIVSAAADGDFSARLESTGKTGFFLDLSNGMNRLMEGVAASLGDLGRVMNAIARGDLTEKITAEYGGTFGQLKDDTNTTVERLREVVSQIKEASES
uniref:PAS domain S-box protein n=1 Tax=Zoogloea sp. TaxID=49181 RepID=UPI0035AFA95C